MLNSHGAVIMSRRRATPRQSSPPSRAPAEKSGCRHCGARKVNRPRGLCWGCYYAPGVRDLYPTRSVHGRRGPGHALAAYGRPLPAEPTHAEPGSEAKIAVMSERVARGEQLFHPRDARVKLN